MLEVGDWVVTTACNTYSPDRFHVVMEILDFRINGMVLIHVDRVGKPLWRDISSYKRVPVFDIVCFKLKESYVQKHMV